GVRIAAGVPRVAGGIDVQSAGVTAGVLGGLGGTGGRVPRSGQFFLVEGVDPSELLVELIQLGRSRRRGRLPPQTVLFRPSRPRREVFGRLARRGLGPRFGGGFETARTGRDRGVLVTARCGGDQCVLGARCRA